MVAGSAVPGLLPLPFMLGVTWLFWVLLWDFGWQLWVGGQIWTSSGHPHDSDCLNSSGNCEFAASDGDKVVGSARSGMEKTPWVRLRARRSVFQQLCPQGHLSFSPYQVCPQHPLGYGNTTSVPWLMFAVDNPPSHLKCPPEEDEIKWPGLV